MRWRESVWTPGKIKGRISITSPHNINEESIWKTSVIRRRYIRILPGEILLFKTDTWILHESEAFICKALKGEAIVDYAEPLITKHMEASGSPAGWKLMRIDRPLSFLLIKYLATLLYSFHTTVVYYYLTFSLIFMQDLGDSLF